jgi:hypothetical protein
MEYKGGAEGTSIFILIRQTVKIQRLFAIEPVPVSDRDDKLL